MSIYLIAILIVLSILTGIRTVILIKKDKDKEKEQDKMLEEIFQVRRKGKK
jgi:hypothetical protein